MTNKQPTALQLAEDLKLHFIYYPEEVLIQAAAELRRLHNENEALRNWIREQSSITDTCVWNILREQCIGCQCHRSWKMRK